MDGRDDDQGDVPADNAARTVGRFGYAALLPMAALAIWLASIDAAHPWRDETIALLTGYGALMLAFAAGAHCGFAPSAHAAAGAAALVAIAWMAPLLPAGGGFVLLALALAAQGAWDAFAVHAEALPDWYGRLRARMTFIAVAAMLLAFVATN